MVIQMLKFKMALLGLLFGLAACPDVDQYKEEQLVDMDVVPDVDQSIQTRPDAIPATDGSTLTDAGTVDDVSVGDATSSVGDTFIPTDGTVLADGTLLADGSVVTDGAAPIERCDVTFTVGFPENTPDGPIFIAGENLIGDEWEPNVEAHALARENSEASITLQLAHLARVEYKYTRGSWMTVEQTANCEELPNRFQLVDCTEAPIILADQVVNWADDCSP